MAEHVDGEIAHVLGDAEVAAVDERARLRARRSAIAPRGETPKASASWLARLVHDREQVGDQRVVELDAGGERCMASTSRVPSTGSSPGSAVAAGSSRSTAASSPRVGVADAAPHQEAVELRLGQRVRAVVLERILGGDHEERARAAGG